MGVALPMGLPRFNESLLHSVSSFASLTGPRIDAVMLQGSYCSCSPRDHYFHTAAGLALKYKALELVISCHLGFTRRNF